MILKISIVIDISTSIYPYFHQLFIGSLTAVLDQWRKSYKNKYKRKR